MAIKVSEPPWLDLPPDQWPPEARNAYSILIEWGRKVAKLRQEALNQNEDQNASASK